MIRTHRIIPGGTGRESEIVEIAEILTARAIAAEPVVAAEAAIELEGGQEHDQVQDHAGKVLEALLRDLCAQGRCL